MNPPNRHLIFDRPAPSGIAPSLFMTDIDGTLILEGSHREQPGLESLKSLLTAPDRGFAWGVATGRRLEKIREIFTEYELPAPDLIVASVGAEVHYDLDGTRPDESWDTPHRPPMVCRRGACRRGSDSWSDPTDEVSQGRFKVSFRVDARSFSRRSLEQALGPRLSDTNVILTRNTHLDLLPRRASKWLAIRHVIQRHGFRLDRLLVAGDSGNDLDMLAHAHHSIIVGNYADELEPLRGRSGAFFSSSPAASGILEGFHHFQFPEGPDAPNAAGHQLAITSGQPAPRLIDHRP